MKKNLCVLGVLGWVLQACASGQVLVANNSNECIIVPQHGYVADGTRVRIDQCRGAANQQWNINNGQITGFAGSCLDVQGSQGNDGAPVVAVSCNGSPSQQWNLANGQIVGIGGKCLDILDGNSFDRAPLIVSTCSAAPSQQWSVH